MGEIHRNIRSSSFGNRNSQHKNLTQLHSAQTDRPHTFIGVRFSSGVVSVNLKGRRVSLAVSDGASVHVRAICLLNYYGAETLSFYCPPVVVVVVSAQFTEDAATQSNHFGPFAGETVWHWNCPVLEVAGTQVSPHALRWHGQTVFTQSLGD